MTSTEALLRLESISKSYPGSPGRSTEGVAVLKNLSLSVQAADALAIIGPSGSGKSTLLNIMSGLDLPTSGRVIFDGCDLAGLGEKALARLRNRRIGFVFQLHHLLPQCSVWENVLIPTLAAGRGESGPGEATLQRAADLLGRVGLSSKLDSRPAELSGGERQRVAVARALINQPGLLLADEPTGSLDRANSEEIARLLVDLNREQGTALVVVTHSMRLAGRFAKLLELVDGQLVPRSGSGAETKGPQREPRP